MTPEEAIEIITNAIQTDNMTAEQDKALAIAQKALEKQIPKNPKGITDPIFGDVTIVCPNCCNANLANPFDISRVYGYCPNCGQALDWSDDK